MFGLWTKTKSKHELFNFFVFQVAEFPENLPFTDGETPHPVPLSDLSKEPFISLSTAPAQTNPAPFELNPAPSSPRSKPPRAKTKEKKAVKKNRGGRR